MGKRSALRPCIYCGHPIFFDDSIAPGRPLQYDQYSNPETHKCKKDKSAKPTVVTADPRLIEDLMKRVENLEDRVKAIEKGAVSR
jgi:hypothetical protein